MSAGVTRHLWRLGFQKPRWSAHAFAGWKFIWLFKLNPLQSNCCALLRYFGCSLQKNCFVVCLLLIWQQDSDARKLYSRHLSCCHFGQWFCPLTRSRKIVFPPRESALSSLALPPESWRLQLKDRDGSKDEWSVDGSWRVESGGGRRWLSVWCDSEQFRIKEGSDAKEDFWKLALKVIEQNVCFWIMSLSYCEKTFVCLFCCEMADCPARQ